MKDLDQLTSEINMYYNYEMSTIIFNQHQTNDNENIN